MEEVAFNGFYWRVLYCEEKAAYGIIGLTECEEGQGFEQNGWLPVRTIL